MGRAGRSGGGSSSSGSRSNFSGGRSSVGSRSSSSSSSKSSFSGGWSSGPSKSRSSSSTSSTKTTTKSTSSSSSFSGGWSSGSRSSSSQRSSSEKHSSSYNPVSRRTYRTVREISNDEVARSFNQNTTVQENPTVANSPRVTNNSNKNGKSSKGIGCLLIFIVFIFGIGLSNSNISSDGDIESTIERTPLDSSQVEFTYTYCYDDLEWISDIDTLAYGMDSFYNHTGVQPILIITDNIDGNYAPTNDEAEAYMTAFYDYLFDDEGHMLVLFMEVNYEHAIWIYCGDDAATVVDEEARDILYSNIEYEYYSDKTEEEMFSDAFSDTGRQIMGVNKNYYTPMLLIIFVILVGTTIRDSIHNSKNSNLETNKLPTSVIDTTLEVSTEEVVVECSGCGAKNKVRVGQVSACEYCDTPIKG